VTDLIFNADDFGLTAGVTRAIVEASERGVVRSTTAMLCRGNDALIRTWAPRMRGRIGIHLQLTDGVPCLPPSEVPSLVGPDGRFPRTRGGIITPVRDEILAEWRAQVARLRDLAVEPSHIDTHHHVHWREAVLPAYIELARTLALPARSGPTPVAAALREANVPSPAALDTVAFTTDITLPRLLRIVRKNMAVHPGAAIEIMCHPGYVDDELRAVSTLVNEREAELALLCSEELHESLETLGVRIASMEVLSDPPQTALPSP
jgi:predicted glycoside hydrolase/deacetylase ChbG (UPF0249 family)